MPQVQFDRSFLLRSLLLALALTWPLILFGQPAYYQDSAVYQNGGARAVAFFLDKVGLAGGAGGGGGMAQGDGSGTVARSIVYSVIGYLFSWPGHRMVGLALLHALGMGFVVTALYQAVAGRALRGWLVTSAILVLTTGIAPVTMFMLPDCFAGMMLGAMAVLPFYWRRMSWPVLALVALTAILAVAVHASHPPVAIGTALLVMAGLLIVGRKRRGALVSRPWLLWAPAVLGSVLTVLTGLIGFGEVSIAPKHYPLALARGLDNGPARWYLNDVCRDRSRYAMCEVYGTNMPLTVDQFLFGPGGVTQRATAEQLDRIRREERVILVRATLRYPFEQAWLILHDVPTQFVSFGVDFMRFDDRLARGADGDLKFVAGSLEPPPLLNVLDIVTNIVVALSALAILWQWRRMTAEQRAMVLTIAAGLAVNAAVCAIFSGIAERYQARLIWLVPFAALAVAFARLDQGRGNGSRW